MQIVNSYNVVFFDVDGTLVNHLGSTDRFPFDETIFVKDILGEKDIRLLPNHKMIRLLREELAKGSKVVVWSRGGYQWAANVLEALDLADKDILVMSKPFAYFDDKDASEWMVNRVFIPLTENYKGR